MIDFKSNKVKIIIGVAGAVIMISVLIVGINYKSKKNIPNGNENMPVGFVESDTKKAVPEGAYVPEADQENADTDLAIPTNVVNAAPDVDAKMRMFDIRADKGIFAPSKISVRKGDTVRISISAIDKDYDFVLPDFGMRQTMKKGEKKAVEFQATNEGLYSYYCEQCGGLDSTATGTITIVP